MREVKINPGFCENAYGSVLIEMGKTRIICAASVEKDVPDHARNRGTGWFTADYTLLPYATPIRKEREFLTRDSRSVEIKRLIGRSLRGSIDLKKLQEYSIHLDCDVVFADGGTRTASVTGGYIALKMAINRMLEEKLLVEDPIIGNVAGISVGIVDKELLLDLEYSEDSEAAVDMNIIMDHNFDIIEIQGTGEKNTFSVTQLNDMIALAQSGIHDLFELQKKTLQQ